MTAKSVTLFDSDSHVIETPAPMWEISRARIPLARQDALRRQQGRTGAYLTINGETVRYTGNPDLPRQALLRPGITWDAIGERDPHIQHSMTEGAGDLPACLADVDAMGVDQISCSALTPRKG